MVVTPPPRLRLFQVCFSDSSRSFYSSGEKLQGYVQLEAAQPRRISGLTISAAGCARVRSHRSRCSEEEYLRYEEELRLEEALSRDADGCFLLPANKTFNFQFGFELPPPGRLVSSYKGKFGSVRYYVRAELMQPSQHALRCEREFEVEEPLDVNRADLLAPAAASVQKKVTCMFIPDGQVSISAQIDRKGFCEGEGISINAKFENTCSRIVVPKAAIVARHSYMADGRVTKVSRQKLSAVRGNHIISGMCDMWQGKTIRVPKLRPTLIGCDIIKVDYALMIYLHIPGSEKLVLELPLVIGTIPFSGVDSRAGSLSSMSSRAGSMSSQAGSLSSQAGSLSSWSTFPSAPPSYSDIHRDLRADDGPRTPLLHDYDGDDHDEDEEDSGLIMRVPKRDYPPPPAYTEVDSLDPPQVV